MFTANEAAEDVKDDPFVVNGVSSRWHIRAWNEIFG